MVVDVHQLLLLSLFYLLCVLTLTGGQDVVNTLGEVQYGTDKVSFPTSLIHFVYQHRRGFDFASPKPVDSIQADSCTTEHCVYKVLIFGWFWETRPVEEMPFLLDISSLDGTWSTQQVAYRSIRTDQGHVSVEAHVVLIVPLRIIMAELKVVVRNQQLQALARGNFILTLLSNEDLHFPNQFQYYDYFIRSQGIDMVQMRDNNKLDFLEIGTSDFHTLLQRTEDMQSLLHRKVIGVSMEAVLQFQRRLPDIPSVFKFNAAVDVFQGVDTAASEVVQVFSLPMHALQHLPRYVRGCIQLNTIHPDAYKEAAVNGLPALIFQKAFVKTYRIATLWDALVKPYFSGLRTLKLDLEGIDQGVVLELLTHLSNVDIAHRPHSDAVKEIRGKANATWPCVLHFETNRWGGFRNTALMELLSSAGYLLLHDFIPDVPARTRGNDIEPYQDTLAFHCHCHPGDYEIASELLRLPDHDSPQLWPFCKNVAEDHDIPVQLNSNPLPFHQI